MIKSILQLIQQIPQKLRRHTGNKRYISEVDGLRFLAILPVMIQHLGERLIRSFPAEFSTPIVEDQLAFAVSRGSVGVFLFFAISGFILTLPFAKAHLKGSNAPTYKTYLKKRLFRIEPPYIIWMCFFFLVLIVRGVYDFSELFPHLVSSLFYSHNIIYGSYSYINPVAWSLEVEIQFYLLAPFLIALFYQIKKGTTRQVILVTSILGYVSVQHYFGWMFFPYKATLLGQLQHFLVGILLADVYLTKGFARFWKNKYGWDVLAIVCFVTMMYTWTEEYWKSLVFAVALTLLFVSIFNGKILSRIFTNSWITMIGGMCYTIYLIHLPLMELQMQLTGSWVITNYYLVNLLVQLAVGLPIILLIAGFFYYWMERPFMNANFWSRFYNWNSQQILSKTAIWTIIFLFIGLGSLSGQTALEDEKLDIEFDVTVPFIPNLDTLVEKALRHSQALKVQNKRIEIRAKQKQIMKKDLLDKVSVGGTLLYGTGTIYDAWSDGENPQDFTSFRRNLAANTGIQVRVSIGDVVKGKQKQQLAQLQLEQTILERSTVEEQIKEEVYRRYDDYVYFQELLSIKAANLEAMRLSLEIAEQYFKKGNLPTTEYTTILSKKIKAEEELTTTKARATHAWRVLKSYCGM